MNECFLFWFVFQRRDIVLVCFYVLSVFCSRPSLYATEAASLDPSLLFGMPFEVSDLLNGPNPFDPSQTVTNIQFFTNDSGTCDYRVYSIRGEELKRDKVNMNVGFNFIEWDGRNDDQALVSNGVYIFYLKCEASDGQVVRDKLKIAVFKQ